MTLKNSAIRILHQLAYVTNQILPHDFARASTTLGGSTIGQHIRHTLEFFICLEAGYRIGVINYDKRGHDRLIETDRELALASIESVIRFVNLLQERANLHLQVGYDRVKEEYTTVDTNSMRELVYNIEHAVHHMAMIKIGIRDVAPYIVLDDDFGIAASTARHGHLEEQPVRDLNGDFPA